MHKYDDVDSHADGNRGTHIGMFFAWAMLRGLVAESWAGDAQRFKQQPKPKGIRFTSLVCDGKLGDEDLTIDGDQFAAAYYEKYLSDYERTLDDEDVKDGSWAHFDEIVHLLDDRYGSLAAEGRPQTPPRGEPKGKEKPPLLPSEALAALEALDKLDPDKRPMSVPVERVLTAVNELAPNDGLRGNLLTQAQKGGWPSA